MSGAGTLVLVVGPSGAGKDTLIAAAKSALGSDGRFCFPKRVVTRQAVAALEDHESLSEVEFALQERNGAYALSWEAHGLHYGLPVALKDDLAQGRVVVLNASRAMIGVARERFPQLQVLLIEASREVRARRLAGRGRESETEVRARLDREVEAEMPGAVRIDNSGELAEGQARFVAAVRAFASN